MPLQRLRRRSRCSTESEDSRNTTFPVSSTSLRSRHLLQWRRGRGIHLVQVLDKLRPTLAFSLFLTSLQAGCKLSMQTADRNRKI